MKTQSFKKSAKKLKAFIFTALTAGFMAAACFSAFALPEVETTAPSGDVVVRPEIEWTDSREFSMECIVTNESGMMIPETEIILKLPEGSGLYFENDGRKNSFSVERNELKEDESFSFSLKGGKEPETAAGETSGEADDELFIRMDIVLRGYGLVHPTKAYLKIPHAPEPEIKKPVFQYRIVADLKETGADDETVSEAETSEYVRSYGFRTDSEALDTGKHKLHFPDLNSADRVKGRRLFAILTGILICILVSRILIKGMEKKEVRILEQQRKFRKFQ